MAEFEKININELKPAEYNPRIMPPQEMEKLKKGLSTFGLVDPIIIDLTDNNTVIGGHQRLEALKELGIETLNLLKFGDAGLVFNETEIRIKDKNDQKALNLSLNKINGEWDYGKLDDLLLELNDDGYNIELTGFEEEDMTFEGFDFQELFEDMDDDEELPPDLNEVQGEQPNHRYLVILAFETKEQANKYLEQINITRKLTQLSAQYRFGVDFNFLEKGGE